MSLQVDIRKKYTGFDLKISFHTMGASLGLLGASGCGKSLTLKCIAGIITPEEGKIILNDRILYDSEKKIALAPKERKIGLLFQNYALFPNMTVRENIKTGIRRKDKKNALLADLTAMLRLEDKLQRYPYQLSGGEQQRVALARILANEPEVLMFDEPFSALDAFLKDQLQQELLEVLREFRGDILMVSHNREEIYRFCKKIVVVNKGRVIECGDKAEIFGSPEVLTTAKLTGCKNISRARKLSDYSVEALDWKLRLVTDRFVEDKVNYVGIRAHNLRPAGEGESANTLPVLRAEVSEGPFEDRFILHCNNTAAEKVSLSWIVARKEWTGALKEQLPDYITLPKEHLLLLSDSNQ